MSLSVVAAKDIEQAHEFLASRPRKAVKDHMTEEPEGVGNFLYDFRAAFTNYHCYYRLNLYKETYLEIDQVPAIRVFADSVLNWLFAHGAEENRVIQQLSGAAAAMGMSGTPEEAQHRMNRQE